MPRRPASAAGEHLMPGAEPESPRPTTPAVAPLPAVAPAPPAAWMPAPIAQTRHEAPAARAAAAEPIAAASAARAAPAEPVAEPASEPNANSAAVEAPAARPPAPRPPAAAPMPQRLNGNGAHPAPGAVDGSIERGATAPQLRRFIKSRAYVPMHELRRRFAITSVDDDVTAVDLDRRRVFVGLPEREGRLLGELLRGGDIGFELSLDPITPIVVGVYPMRPVTRT